MKFPELDRMLDTFTALFGTKVIAAGGCVRDLVMGNEPKDYDLFILDQHWDSNEEAWLSYKESLGEKLKDFPEVDIEIEWHKSEPFLIKTITFDGKEVQIMATPCQTAMELRATFDWKCCCFSYESGRDAVFNPEDVPEAGEHLKLQKITFPYSTLRRGYRFSERFHMRLKQEDLHSLCKRILEKDKDNEQTLTGSPEA